MTFKMSAAVGIAIASASCAVPTTLAENPTPPPTKEQSTRIEVSTGEPVAAESQQLAIVGSCYGVQVAVRFFPDHQFGEHYATVKVGDASEQRYDATTSFVKDLFVGSKAAYQFRLFCNKDAYKSIMLTALGMSLALVEPKYLYAKVTFDSSGKILNYGPPRAEDPSFIRRGLR